MDSDPTITNWVLNYFVSQPLEDRTLNSLLCALPLTDQPNFKKSLLLKILESEISCDSVSERTLELLERLEDMEFQQGNEAVSDAMKRAYCAAAVDCTVKILRDGGCADKRKRFEYLEAVKSVWRGRVGKMKEVVEKGGLGSQQLWVWKDEIEEAVWDDHLAETVVKKSESVKAVEAVSCYIREEREKMGPPFLDLVAETVPSDESLQRILGVDRPDQVAGKEAPSNCVDGSNANKEMQRRRIKLRDKLVGIRRVRGLASGTSRGAKIVDLNEKINGSPNGQHNVSGCSKVNKVPEALDASSLELHAVVTDSLPDASKFAEGISSEARNDERQNPADNHVESNSLVVDNAGVVQATTGNTSGVPKTSLIEWNSSAHTNEYTIETTHEDPADRSIVHLPSPEMINTSPLDIYKVKIKERRKGRKWSPMEEDALRAGVEKYGKGNWKLILTLNRDIFEGRTEVDLKDKWRNLTRY